MSEHLQESHSSIALAASDDLKNVTNPYPLFSFFWGSIATYECSISPYF